MLEGGCDHDWTVGKAAVVLLLVAARRGGTWARFARDRKRIMAAARLHVDRPISSKSTGGDVDVAGTLLLAWGRRFDRLGSVTRGSRRPISSFVGHLINTRGSYIYDSLFSEIYFLYSFVAQNRSKSTLSPIFLRQHHRTSNFTACPLKPIHPSPFNSISQDASLQCKQLNHPHIILQAVMLTRLYRSP